MLFGLIELGFIYVANMSLSNSTLNLARQIRVGLVVAPGTSATSSSGNQMDLSDFKAAICSGMTIVSASTCMNQLQIDVRTQTSFQNMASVNPIAHNNFNTAGFCFYSGVPGSIVTMTAYYLWPVQTPLLFQALSNITMVTTSAGTGYGNYFVLVSSEIFKNEPSASASNTGAGC